MKDSPRKQTMLTISNGASRTKELTGLAKYTEYEVRLLAFTSVGDGPKSVVKFVKTNEDIPSKAPGNFSLAATSSTSIKAFWQLPPADSRNGIVRGFRLFYKRKDSLELQTLVSVKNGTTRSKLVTGLDKYTVYEFQVLAFTSVGDGINSSIVAKRTKEDVPSIAPSNLTVAVINSTSVTVSWQVRPEIFSNGIIGGFKLFYRKNSSAVLPTILTIKNGTIHRQDITGLDRYTRYEFQVLAFTSVGDGPKSAVLVERTKEDVPSQAPGNFTVTTGSSTSITAAWQLPQVDSRNGIISGFKLFYRKKSSAGKEITLVIANGTSRSKTLTGLAKYTEYEFELLAFTSVGDGPKSSVKVAKTKEDIPSKAPGNFTLCPASSTRITVSWKLPPADSRHGILRGFKLFYRKKGPAGLQTVITIKNGTDRSKLVTGLEKYTEYEFQMLAFTSVGDGPKTPLRFERTNEDVPYTAPRNLTVAASNSTSVTVSWQLPPEISRNGVIRGLKVLYREKSSAALPRILTINNGTIESQAVTGLDKYTQYDFQVVAFTSVGDGPRSSVVVERTKEDVPSQAPSNFTVTSSNSTSIEVMWQLPPADSRNGIITGYKLFYKKNGSAARPTWLTISNGTTHYKKLTGLAKYTKYEFQLLAFTSVGDGPKSSIKVGETNEDAPSKPPSNFTVKASSSTSIGASWQLPPADSRHGIIIGFKLYYQKRGSPTLQTLLTIKNGKVRSKPVTGLAQFTEYEFQVLAFTSVGDGPKSSTMVERTKEDAPSQAPSNFSLIVRSSTSISTSWQLPPAKSRNGIITGFKVFFKKKGSAKLPASITINGTTQTKDVTELEKYTEYEFQVLAFTSVGDGPKSYVRIKRTKEDVPSKSPRNFTVAASSSSSMTASWQLPPKDSRNGIVRGFKLLFKKRGVIGLPNTLTIGNGTVRTRDVFGLDKYTEYEFQVLAFTSVGDGAKSSAKVARTKEDAPSKAPSNFSVMASNSTSITAFWQLPPANSRNGIITGFKLFFRKRGSARLPVDLTISNGQIRFKHVTGLNKYSEYEFQVLAFTSVGDGPRSTVVVMRTMEDVPSHSPRNFSVTARSSTTVTASWQLPSVEFRHGFIIGFKISYQKKDPVATTVILNITNGTVETIEITGLDKYTEYEFQILAFTSAGNGPWSPLVVRRTKEDVPTGSPDNFTVVVSSSTSITATWQLPPTDVRNGIITGFKLFYRKKEFLHLPTTLTITNSTSRRKIVTGLDKYTEYQFQVLAFTFVGEGPNSPVKVQRTAEDVPSGSPSNFILTASSSTSITASWQLPPADSRNGIILGFNLFYKIKGSGDLLTMITINNGTASNEDVTGLEKYTEYEFQMLAFTSVGDGPNSSVKIERTREDVPSKSPSNFTVTVSSSTSIMTSWHLPPEDFRNGRVQGFKLYYKKKGSTGLPNTITIRNGTFLTKDFIGLEKYTEYEFQVLAFTSVGDGPKSSVEVARTKEDVPSKAPGNFSVTASNSTAITATWQLPPGDSRNGIITGFKLFFVKKGSAGLQVALTISNGQIRFKHVNGLDKYTEYEFQVLAFTSVGDGPRSAVVVERTMEDVPSRAPSNLNVTASSSTSVTASWQLPSIESRHGIITGFKLSYRENVTTAAPVILNITNGTVEAKDIAGLDKYTEYEFQVLAFTSVGDGPKSPVVVVRTEEDVPSRSPNNFTLVVTSSTSITVSWQLPPVEARNGIITGFKLFYKKKGFINLSTTSAISNGTSRYKIVTGLDKYTEYEFQMLAFTSVGDGPNSSVEVERTAEDAPSKAPENFTVTAHSSTSITAYWQLPPTASRNGIIVGFKLFYKKIDSAASATMIILNNGTINIRNVTGLDEYAEYEFQLLAFTPVGDGPKSSLQFAKTMEDVPSEAPTNFTLTASSSTSITVGWQLPPKDSRNGVITGFKLFYKNKGSILAPTCLTIYNGTTRTRVAAKLDEYTEYEFQVSAFTSVGDGPKSSVEVERTMEDVPSGYPSNFTVAASSSTSITTFWQLPPTYSRNGIIVGFKLFYKRKRSGGSATMITINNGTTDTKNITGLVKYTEYEFQMLAFTSVGDGPNSSVEITRTKEDVPSKPPSNFSVTASSSTSITASWQLPSANFRNGIITGYKLLYKKKHSVAPVTRSTVFNVSIHTENITGLDKYTEYEFQVLAFTSVGDGSKSSLHVERTKEDAPSKAPANVSVTAKSSTSFIVSWQPPPENGRNGIITGFKLFYKERSSEGTATTVTINGEASLRRDVSGLNKYTEYEFQVLAFTSAGEGPTSAVKVERTKEDAPSSPLSFSYKEVAPNAELHGPRINLTWSKPTEANGIIRSYTVFYANQEGETNRSVGGNTFSYLVDVLGGVTYHFYVRAVTIKPGQNASFSVKTYEYEPSRAPENVSSIKVEYTKYQITWDALTREVANGLIKMYQVRLTLKESCTSVDASFNSTYNTTKTEMLFSSLSICTSYEVSVRAFTEAGPGPYSKPLVIQTLGTLWSLEKPSPPAFSTNSSDRGITAKITFPNFPGHANFFQVIVITYRSDYTGVVNPQADFTTQDLMTYEDAHKSPLPAAYVTFQFGGDDFYKNQEFTVGDGVHSSSKIRSKSSDAEEYYYNKPLQLNTNYRVFLRAFVSEVALTIYNLSWFHKPVVKELPETTTIIVGELAVLTCEASGDPQPSVTWSKDGDTSISRAKFNNDGHILVIRNVMPRDSGVYECTASNTFGASHSATTLIVAGSCVDLDLGMENRKIPDGKITASSEKNVDTQAKNGRLNYTSGSSWCAGTSDSNPYLQIDLQTLHIICAVSTQGSFKVDQWVKTYTLQLSTNGTTWTDYREDGQVKFLRGNDDRNSEMKHVVYGVLTRYLRFLPQTHQGGVCMRTEVFGVKQKPTCDTEAIGLASGGKIPDSSFSSSSYFGNDYKPSYARLNGSSRGWAPKNRANPADYLQIDLLYEYIICAVATQGANGINEWTTKYKIQLSLDGTTFVVYRNNSDRLFPGNSNRNGITKNSLQDFASAKFIRFQPTEYNAYKALRVEVYGILLTRVPSKPPTAFKLNATSSTSITASWQLPPVFARHGRSITGFKLFFKKKGSVGLATTLLVKSGSASSRNFTGLEKYTEYEFQILAFTSDGDGSKSPVKVERTKEDASWQLPPANSRNGKIKGFKLFYKKRCSNGSTTILTINNGSELSTNVSGLDNNTEYEFQVLAFTSKGDGPMSSPVVARTLKYGCVEFYLGLENERILDDRMTAPTEQSASTPAHNGRSNYTRGSSWCARTSDTNPYLQIDLQTVHIICAVPTQENSQGGQWVKNYTLQFSIDGTNWTDYKEGRHVKVLQGNNDGNSNVKRAVYGVLARYVRYQPQTHQGRVCLRREVFGGKQKPSTHTIFLTSVITLSCLVLVLLIITCGLLWHRRRTVPYDKKIKGEVGLDGFHPSRDIKSCDQPASDACSDWELKSKPPSEQSEITNEYQSIDEEAGTAAYYNTTIHKESDEKQNEEVYEEIREFHN
ncbi:Protein sidekick-2 [Stylophora pistillata]|uniref:Protein sidekick-2 n=1 Tax=Stylophora pistillata TaxID=50429 RepID=A0A2B4SP07_STYPI|nr:Protein sidekick-2 [Stylophora pistillata]